MSDSSVISFPRVVVELSDPTPAQNKDEGYVEGTIWVNKNTSTIFTLVDRNIGKWVTVLSTDPLGGGGMTFGDGSDQDTHFDLGSGDFTVDADNFSLDTVGNVEIGGSSLIFNKDNTTGSPFIPGAKIEVPRGDLANAYLDWYEPKHQWRAGFHEEPDQRRLYPIVNCVESSRDPLPSDNFADNYYRGQLWLNLPSNRLFMCTHCPDVGDAVWREILTDAAPETDRVVDASSFILYNNDDRRYSEISWNNMIQFVIDAVGGFGPATIGFGWQVDANENVAPSNEDPIDNGLFEDDGNGDLTPLVSPETDADVFFELDGNDDITLQAA